MNIHSSLEDQQRAIGLSWTKAVEVVEVVELVSAPDPPALSAGSRRYKCSVLPGAPLQAGLPTQPSAADPARQVVGGARRLWQPIAAHAAQHGFNRRWQINLIANRDKQRVGVWPCAHHHPNRLALVQQR